MAVVLLTATVALAAGGVRAARHRALAAADLAALAAAARAAAGSGPACRAAEEVAAGSGGRLSGCVLRGGIADVTVVVTVRAPEPLGVLRLRARARAGPADPVPYAGHSSVRSVNSTLECARRVASATGRSGRRRFVTHL